MPRLDDSAVRAQTAASVGDPSPEAPVVEDPVADTPDVGQPGETASDASEETTSDAPEEGRPPVKVKLNPDFEPAQEEGVANLQIANHEDIKLSDKPVELDATAADLALSSPAVVRAD